MKDMMLSLIDGEFKLTPIKEIEDMKREQERDFSKLNRNIKLNKLDRKK